jgi:hypothetical protein
MQAITSTTSPSVKMFSDGEGQEASEIQWCQTSGSGDSGAGNPFLHGCLGINPAKQNFDKEQCPDDRVINLVSVSERRKIHVELESELGQE